MPFAGDEPVVSVSAALLLPVVAALALLALQRCGRHEIRLTWLGPLALAGSGGLLLGVWPKIIAAPVTVALPIGTLRLDSLGVLAALIVVVVMVLWWSRGEDHDHPLARDAARLFLASAALVVPLTTEPLLWALGGELGVLSFLALVRTYRQAPAPRAVQLAQGGGAVLVMAGVVFLFTERVTVETAGILSSVGVMLVLGGWAVHCVSLPLAPWQAPVTVVMPARVTMLASGVLCSMLTVALVRWALPFAGNILVPIGLCAALFGVVSLQRATTAARALATWSIGQLGLTWLAFAAPSPWGPMLGLAWLLHRLVLLAAGAGLATRWHGPLTELRGMGHAVPATAIGLMVLVLSVLGVPPLPGFWLRVLLVLAWAGAELPGHLLIMAAVLVVTLGEALILLHALRRFYDPAPAEIPAWRLPTVVDRALTGTCAVLMLAAAFFFPFDFLAQAVADTR